MKFFCILSGILLAAAVLVLLTAWICFRMAFFVTPEQKAQAQESCVPEGEIYEPFRDCMTAWTMEARSIAHKEFTVRSFDGLTLHGNYYECTPGAPIELMFHGYRGAAERDLSGGVQRCFALGRNALIVDQRASGRSGGNIITFGVNESRDCLSWLELMIQVFGPDVQIILCGISMGAATVLMAAGRPLPENVVGVLADCGYTSPRDIIQKTIREMKLPPKLAYPFVKLGARIFGHFDLEELPPLEAMKQCTVPVIFFHGDTDDFVPCWMSQRNFEACTARKKLVIVPGAGHGLSYLIDQELYLRELADFFPEYTSAAAYTTIS